MQKRIHHWEILVRDNAASERSFALQEGSLSVGTSPDCAIVSSASRVAPRHAEFVTVAGTLQIRIAADAPPVRINGTSFHEHADVPCPATIEIGSLRLHVRQAAAPPPAQPASDSTLRIVHLAGRPARGQNRDASAPLSLKLGSASLAAVKSEPTAIRFEVVVLEAGGTALEITTSSAPPGTKPATVKDILLTPVLEERKPCPPLLVWGCPDRPDLLSPPGPIRSPTVSQDPAEKANAFYHCS